MRYVKSSYLGVAGLCTLALLLYLVPQLGGQRVSSAVRLSSGPPLPLVGLFKSAQQFVLRKS